MSAPSPALKAVQVRAMLARLQQTKGHILPSWDRNAPRKPADVIAAEKVIAKWNAAENKRRDAERGKNRAFFSQCEIDVLYGDQAKAIAAVERAEKLAAERQRRK